jgi:hypothetical protein
MIHIIIVTVISGLLAVLFDLIIRQIFIGITIEKNNLPKECKKYKGTMTHLISTFIVGSVLFLIFRFSNLNKLTK